MAQKQVNAAGVTRIGTKIKSYVDSVKTTLEKSLSSVDTAKQDVLVSGTNIKTINGETLLGSGDITIDLSLYKLVSSLPTSGIDADKIYLVASDTTGTSNVYTEYVYVNSAWEKLGEYKSDVDLTDYAKTADVDDALALKADKSDTYTKSEVDAKVTASGTFSDAEKTKLAGIETGAEVNVIETVKVDGTALSVSGKAVNIDLSGKVDVEDGKGLSTNDYTDGEKSKLAGIATGAEVNQNAFSNVAVGSVTIVADNKTDTLTLAAGSNVTITPDATNDKITIAAQDTHYASKNVVGSSVTDGSDTEDSLENGSVRLNSVENGATTSSHVIKGTGAATVTYDGNGTIIVNSTDTTYSEATSSAAGLMSAADCAKLAAIDAAATADEALTDAEIDAALAEAGIL